MTQSSRIRVVVLGSARVGKSAVTVRYLTKRFIGEYSSDSEFLYRHSVCLDGGEVDLEVLDTCTCAGGGGCLAEHARWGEAFVVVYSVTERASFVAAADLLAQLARLRLPGDFSALLLANKRDLDHARQVSLAAGQELALRAGCHFEEVSAAAAGDALATAFQALLRHARSLRLLRALPLRRRLAVNSVSKVLGNIFGKNAGSGANSGGSNGNSNGAAKSDRRKRPSLSI